MTPCPSAEALVRFVDRALSVDESGRLEVHLARCDKCRAHEKSLRGLIEDLGGDVAADAPFDVLAHSRAVMGRVSAIEAAGTRDQRGAPQSSTRAWWPVAASLVCAAAVGGLLLTHSFRLTPASPEVFASRGGPKVSTTVRDVGVVPYALEIPPRPLTSGAVIHPATPVTAGFRNLGDRPAFLLLFAVDASNVVHWITPAFAREGENPASTKLAPTATERVLPTTAVFAAPSPGALRILSVITAAEAHVSDIESLSSSKLTAAAIELALPGADVRETLVLMNPEVEVK